MNQYNVTYYPNINLYRVRVISTLRDKATAMADYISGNYNTVVEVQFHINKTSDIYVGAKEGDNCYGTELKKHIDTYLRTLTL